jgi:hypothetical protein
VSCISEADLELPELVTGMEIDLVSELNRSLVGTVGLQNQTCVKNTKSAILPYD